MTRAEVSEKIARMKAVQRGLVKAVGSDYNDQRRFQVREIEVNGKVVSQLMKIDTNLKYLPSEDLFNEIYDLHVGSGHCGRDLQNKKIKEKFANVTIENISVFLKTCQFCQPPFPQHITSLLKKIQIEVIHPYVNALPGLLFFSDPPFAPHAINMSKKEGV